MSKVQKPEGYPETPEHDKITDRVRQNADLFQAVLDFLEEKGVDLSIEHESGIGMYDEYIDRERLMHEFLGLNLDLINTEKEAVYAYLRAHPLTPTFVRLGE